MTLDPIVQEVREARAAIAAEFGYDLSQYLVWIREQTQIQKREPQQNRGEETPGDNRPGLTANRDRHSEASYTPRPGLCWNDFFV
jgi:hypothetical protein